MIKKIIYSLYRRAIDKTDEAYFDRLKMIKSPVLVVGFQPDLNSLDITAFEIKDNQIKSSLSKHYFLLRPNPFNDDNHEQIKCDKFNRTLIKALLKRVGLHGWLMLQLKGFGCDEFLSHQSTKDPFVMAQILGESDGITQYTIVKIYDEPVVKVDDESAARKIIWTRFPPKD